MGQTRVRHSGVKSGRQPVPRASGDPFWDLVAVARRLHAPGGCAWDRAQTVNSLLPYLVEETWEVFESVRSGHPEELEGELGDVLYTVLFLALLGEQDGTARLDDLLTRSREKMVRRHPHVFGNRAARTAAEALLHWQQIKRREGRKRRSTSKRLRKLLVACWEYVRADPKAAGRLKAFLSKESRAST